MEEKHEEVVIQATDVTKYYGGFKAVDAVSFTLRRGEVLGFLGPNGAGKTTTMKVLTCYFAPSAGKVSVKGFDVFTNPFEVKQRLGYLPENAPLYADMTAREYLSFVASVRDIPPGKTAGKIADIAQVCGLEKVLGQQIGTLSKGYRQRVGLAQAMIHDPEVLILDEPTSGLDPNQIVEIRNLIKEISRRKTIILSTHNLSEVQMSCNRVIIIHHGKIVADAPTDQIQTKMGKNSYRLVLAGAGIDPTQAADRLRAIPGVEAAKGRRSEEEAAAVFDVEGRGDTDLRPSLFGFAVQGGHTLLELRRERQNLESVFMQLTRE